MRVRVFFLASLLLALTGLCAVQQASRQVRAEYALAKVKKHETRLRTEIDVLRAREAKLVGVERLEELNTRLALDTQPLRAIPPDDGGTPAYSMANR